MIQIIVLCSVNLPGDAWTVPVAGAVLLTVILAILPLGIGGQPLAPGLESKTGFGVLSLPPTLSSPRPNSIRRLGAIAFDFDSCTSNESENDGTNRRVRRRLRVGRDSVTTTATESLCPPEPDFGEDLSDWEM